MVGNAETKDHILYNKFNYFVEELQIKCAVILYLFLSMITMSFSLIAHQFNKIELFKMYIYIFKTFINWTKGFQKFQSKNKFPQIGYVDCAHTIT